jgi:hypothetical protein
LGIGLFGTNESVSNLVSGDGLLLEDVKHCLFLLVCCVVLFLSVFIIALT